MGANRKAGLVTAGVSAVFLALSLQLDSGLSTGAVGVSGTPVLIASLSLILGLALVTFPGEGQRIRWPERSGLSAVAMMIVLLVVYGYALELIGFVAASLVFMFCLFRIFSVSMKNSAVISIVSTTAVYVLFDYLLEISLPIGDLVRVWIS